MVLESALTGWDVAYTDEVEEWWRELLWIVCVFPGNNAAGGSEMKWKDFFGKT